MIDKAAIEQQLAELPLFQYDWITTSELVFSERVRYICQTQCPMYNTTWACPPAVGTVEECKARCLSYPEALMMTSITEVSDIGRGDPRTFHRGLRHLSKMRLPGRTVPSPGPDVPLCGEPGHSGHRPCRKARSGFHERQHRRLVLADPI